eukprot:320977_1
MSSDVVEFPMCDTFINLPNDLVAPDFGKREVDGVFLYGLTTSVDDLMTEVDNPPPIGVVELCANDYFETAISRISKKDLEAARDYVMPVGRADVINGKPGVKYMDALD